MRQCASVCTLFRSASTCVVSVDWHAASPAVRDCAARIARGVWSSQLHVWTIASLLYIYGPLFVAATLHAAARTYNSLDWPPPPPPHKTRQ